MIDVVFLLLIFFMLAARFGQEGALVLTGGASGAQGWQGPPRLVDFTPAEVRLNGAPMPIDALPDALLSMMQSGGDAVILRPLDGASLQHLTDLSEQLMAAGITRLILVEP